MLFSFTFLIAAQDTDKEKQEKTRKDKIHVKIEGLEDLEKALEKLEVHLEGLEKFEKAMEKLEIRVEGLEELEKLKDLHVELECLESLECLGALEVLKDFDFDFDFDFDWEWDDHIKKDKKEDKKIKKK